ncbi:MAG TPA: PQQ-binding-like beta-propeller repeat protein [Gemmataceae bacterium]|nr:PQQ-binding-like beta-propeller repeat protein [Gemmataceae bacterium]
MKRLLLAGSTLFLLMAGVFAQTPYRVYTSPKLPQRDALERMNLVMAWNARVRVDGNRDGVFSVQLIPGDKQNQLVVQTNKGAVYLYDADNGDLLWKTEVGVPFWTPQPAAFNSQSIIVTRRNMLYVLDRKTGAQRVFTYEPEIRRATFGYELAASPNASLVADEDFVYVPMGDRLNAIFIPDFAAIERTRKSVEAAQKAGKPILEDKRNAVDEPLVPTGPDSPQPEFYFGWRFANEIMTSPPLIYGEQLSMVTTDGVLTSINRHQRGDRHELFEFEAHGKVLGGAGQYRNIAYLASSDFNLYAINMNGGHLVWRYVSGAPLVRKPEVNDRDIFISPEGNGLRRIDRETGKEIWTNRDTISFVAANHTNVYALDRIGKFYVLDARRGTTLAWYDLSNWKIAVANEWTDRIYLAAADGQVLCLRHRDLTKPLVMKTEEAPKVIEKKIEKKKEEKKDDEKKDDEKKDDKDKKDDKEKDKDKQALFRPAALPILPRMARIEARRHDGLALNEHLAWTKR